MLNMVVRQPVLYYIRRLPYYAPQVKLVHDLFMLSGLVSEFNLSIRNLRGFITTVSRSYHQAVPYHNFNHVCHVTHSVWLVSTLQRLNLCLCLTYFSCAMYSRFPYATLCNYSGSFGVLCRCCKLPHYLVC
jgi:hypothetical protein